MIKRLICSAFLLLGITFLTVSCNSGGGGSTITSSTGSNSFVQGYREEDLTLVTEPSGNVAMLWRRSTPNLYGRPWGQYHSAASGWSQPELIPNNDQSVLRDSIRLVPHTNGNFTAVWVNSSGSRGQIWASQYIVGLGWTAAELIKDVVSGNIEDLPAIVVDPAGAVTVAWSTVANGRWEVQAIRHEPGVGWGNEQLLGFSANGVSWVRLAVDQSANVIATWKQWEATGQSIWGNRYSSSWGTAAAISSSVHTISWRNPPQLQMNASGTAIITWQSISATGGYSLWANVYTPGTGWAAESDLGSVGTLEISFSNVIDASGDAVVVWGNVDMFANRYTQGVGWSGRETIESFTDGFAQSPNVVIDGVGNAMVTWEQHTDDVSVVYANRYEKGVGWGTEEKVGQDSPVFGGYRVNSNAAGDVVLGWIQLDAGSTFRNEIFSLWMNRYIPGSGWTGASTVEQETEFSTSDFGQAIDQNGTVTIAWFQDAPGYGGALYVNRHSPATGWGAAQTVGGEQAR